MAVTTGTKPVVSTGDEQQEPERHTVPLHMLRVPRDGKVVAISFRVGQQPESPGDDRVLFPADCGINHLDITK